MDDHQKYLARCLFTEDQMVTYRTLSRAMKVHVNTAKAMLYEFHQQQNSTSEGKVHATYIISGTKKPATQPDGDVNMTSSAPDAERWGEEVPTQTVTLVTEERLKDVLDEYSSVTSFQMYSLAAHPVKDLQLLSDLSREAYQQVDVDHGEQSKVFGTIANRHMKKRARQDKRPAAQPAPTPVEKKPALAKTSSTAPPAEPSKVKEEPKPAVKGEATGVTETPASSASSKKTTTAPKKGGIMSAFSKAASKPKAKPGSNVSTPKTDTQSPALSDDGEDDEDPMPAPKKAADGSARRSRQDREAELRRMMEEESDEEEEPEEKEPDDEPMEDAPEPEPESKVEPEAEQEPTEVVSSTGSGRRRGRRQVMKKKQVMDDQGYLVTIQEKGWESFSEDEPAPVSSKPKSTPTSSSGSQGPKKKAAPKAQGNIMSFFSKK